MHYQQQLCAAPVLVPTMADFGALTAAIAAMPGAVAAAVAAVVPGAVAVAVAPLTAQVTMLAAQVTNIPIRAYNQRQNTIAQADGMPGPYRQPLKVCFPLVVAVSCVVRLTCWCQGQAGNGAGLPGMPPLPAGGPAVLAVAAAVAAAPVAVGAVPLAGVFPADDTAIDTMSHADLQILSVIYNETFHIIAIDNLGQRRRKFRSWLCD